jgi:multiple sugar transport system substrate-binding protein
LETASDYIGWLTGIDVQSGLYFATGGQPAHLRAWLDLNVNLQTSQFFLDTLSTLKGAYARPRYKGYVSFQKRAGRRIHKFLNEGGTPGEVLADLDVFYRQSLADP